MVIFLISLEDSYLIRYYQTPDDEVALGHDINLLTHHKHQVPEVLRMICTLSRTAVGVPDTADTKIPSLRASFSTVIHF